MAFIIPAGPHALRWPICDFTDLTPTDAWNSRFLNKVQNVSSVVSLTGVEVPLQ
jgi:hypothetical protein